MDFKSDHLRIDKRSLALHRQVAAKLRSNPALVTRAKDNLARWRSKSREEVWMAEWDAILAQPVDYVANFLCDAGERATRLRQSSPFTGILTQEERRAVYAASKLEPA